MHKKMNDLSEELMNIAILISRYQCDGRIIEDETIDDLARASGKLLAWSQYLETKENLKVDI